MLNVKPVGLPSPDADDVTNDQLALRSGGKPPPVDIGTWKGGMVAAVGMAAAVELMAAAVVAWGGGLTIR